jgi:hypothetical protein
VLQRSGAIAVGMLGPCNTSMETQLIQGARSSLTMWSDALAVNEDRLGLGGLVESGCYGGLFQGILETERYTTVMGFRDGHFYVPWVMIALP